jgi:endonuclease YncB( thermonuclease family)
LSVASGEGGGFSVTIDDEQEVSQTIAGVGEWGDERSVYVGNVEISGQSKEISISISGVSQAEVFRLHGLVLAPVGTWEARQVEKATDSVKTDPDQPPFTKFTGVRFISDPANDGDSAYFLVDGKRWRFRAFFVRSPLDAGDKLASGDKDALRAVASAAKYFGIKASDASAIGVGAKDFMRQMFGGKDLTVYTRIKEGESSNGTVSRPIPAFLVADGKLLSEQLVVSGLAMLNGIPTDLPDGTDAKTYYRRLKEKETKAQEEGLGGWGL